MKSRPASRARGRLLRVVAVLLSAWFCRTPLAAVEPAAPAKPRPDATHILFMGTDLAVEWAGALRPITGVNGNEFVVDVNGRPTVVSGNKNTGRIRADSNVKISTVSADLTELKADRIYTPANDPHEKLQGWMSYSAGSSGLSDLAARDMRIAGSAAGLAGASLADAGPFDVAARTASFNAASARADSAAGAFIQSSTDAMTDLNDIGLHVSEVERELAEKRFDAISLTFKLSSHQPLTQAYVVAIVRYREAADKPDTEQSLVYAQSLPAINDKPRVVRLRRGGLPPGYELKEYQVHLYDHGNEIATNVSPNQMALTRNEAFQVAVPDYVARNKDKTLPPAPATGFWLPDSGKRLMDASTKGVVYVKVDKDGKPGGAFQDQACSRSVGDAPLQAAVTDLLFNPALDKGKPVAGVSALLLRAM